MDGPAHELASLEALQSCLDSHGQGSISEIQHTADLEISGTKCKLSQHSVQHVCNVTKDLYDLIIILNYYINYINTYIFQKKEKQIFHDVSCIASLMYISLMHRPSAEIGEAAAAN